MHSPIDVKAAAVCKLAEALATNDYDSWTEPCLPLPRSVGDVERFQQNYISYAGELVELIWPYAHREGRRAAAEAIQQHADEWAPAGGNREQLTLRRHLGIAGRVAAGSLTPEEIAEAIRRGDFAACVLDDAGRSIRPKGRDTGA